MIGTAALFVLLLAATVPPVLAISAPWYQVATETKAALAADKYVATSATSNGSAIVLTVEVAPCCGSAGSSRLAGLRCSARCAAMTRKARCLSTLLAAAAAARSAHLPVKLAVRVLHNAVEVAPRRPPRTVAVAVDLLQNAMLGNSYFVSASLRSMPGSADSASALFQPKVAQVYADDLSELGGLQTLTVAALMEQALNLGLLGIKSTSNRCDGFNCLVTS